MLWKTSCEISALFLLREPGLGHPPCLSLISFVKGQYSFNKLEFLLAPSLWTGGWECKQKRWDDLRWLWGQAFWIQTPALPISSCVTLEKFLNLSVPVSSLVVVMIVLKAIQTLGTPQVVAVYFCLDGDLSPAMTLQLLPPPAFV